MNRDRKFRCDPASWTKGSNSLIEARATRAVSRAPIICSVPESRPARRTAAGRSARVAERPTPAIHARRKQPQDRGRIQSPGPSKRSAAAGVFILNWWAFDRTERTEHAAIALFRTKDCLAVAALVEKQAGVRGHRFLPRKAAVRTGQYRFEHDSVISNCTRRWVFFCMTIARAAT